MAAYPTLRKGSYSPRSRRRASARPQAGAHVWLGLSGSTARRSSWQCVGSVRRKCWNAACPGSYARGGCAPNTSREQSRRLCAEVSSGGSAYQSGPATSARRRGSCTPI